MPSLLYHWRSSLCLYIQLPLVKAVTGYAYNSRFLHFSLFSAIPWIVTCRAELLMLCAKMWPIQLSCSSCSSDSFLQPHHSMFAVDQLQHLQVVSTRQSFPITRFLHFYVFSWMPKPVCNMTYTFWLLNGCIFTIWYGFYNLKETLSVSTAKILCVSYTTICYWPLEMFSLFVMIQFLQWILWTLQSTTAFMMGLTALTVLCQTVNTTLSLFQGM